MKVNLNKLNNDLSAAVLGSGRFEELLSELGCDVKGVPGGVVFRGPCPVHLGDGHNFEVRADGSTFPIVWACFSRHCEKGGRLKNNLLGLVRGALSGDPDRPAKVETARAFVEGFLARGGDRPKPLRRPTARPTRTTMALSREEVRGRLVIPSPYFVSRGFSPAVLDRLDIGDSAKLGRAVVPIYDDRDEVCVGFITRAIPFHTSRVSSSGSQADSEGVRSRSR